MLGASCSARPCRIAGPSNGAQRVSRPAQLPNRSAGAPRRRRATLPVAAIADPAAAAMMTHELHQFCLTLIGMGSVACLASAIVMMGQRAAERLQGAAAASGSVRASKDQAVGGGKLATGMGNKGAAARQAPAAHRPTAEPQQASAAHTAAAASQPAQAGAAYAAAATTPQRAEAAPPASSDKKPAAAPERLAAGLLVTSQLQIAAAAKLPAKAAVVQQQPQQQQPVAAVELINIKAELQQAAAAAVAAVKSAAAQPAVFNRRPVVAASAAPNGDAVKPGMTVEQATQQVKDWIAAWRTDSDETAQPIQTSASSAPIKRTTEPSLPTSAAAVLIAMTADAPVGATPWTPAASAADPPAPAAGGGAAAGPDKDPQPQFATAAAAATSAPAAADRALAPAAAGQPSTQEREAAYRQRINAVMAKSKLAHGTTLAQLQSHPSPTLTAKRTSKAVEVGPDYQAKIDTLWATYEDKKSQEAALLARSNKILRDLAQKQVMEQRAAVVAPAITQQQQRQQQEGFLAMLLAGLLAVFQAVQRWIAGLLDALTGGSSNGGGAAAGARG